MCATEEISEQEQTFGDGGRPQLLDVVTIPMLEPRPVNHQQENHLINENCRWKKTGSVNNRRLPELLDKPAQLWENGNSSKVGNNDGVAAGNMQNIDNSLFFIKPESLTITVVWKTHSTGKEVRANFGYNKEQYYLKVTDTIAESKYENKSLQEYQQQGLEMPRDYPIPIDNVYLCVSLAEKIFHGHYYKLTAAIVGVPD